MKAITWAKTAEAGEYLAFYDESTPDPGSRCGYSHSELAKVVYILKDRGLRLTSDDLGLLAVARGDES